jgi:hypothetical protein
VTRIACHKVGEILSETLGWLWLAPRCRGCIPRKHRGRWVALRSNSCVTRQLLASAPRHTDLQCRQSTATARRYNICTRRSSTLRWSLCSPRSTPKRQNMVIRAFATVDGSWFLLVALGNRSAPSIATLFNITPMRYVMS